MGIIVFARQAACMHARTHERELSASSTLSRPYREAVQTGSLHPGGTQVQLAFSSLACVSAVRIAVTDARRKARHRQGPSR